MMVPLKSFNSITYKAYQKQLMLGLFLFSSLFITTMISGICPAPKSKFAEATNTFLLNTFPPNLYLTHNCISTLRSNRKYFHILASNRRYCWRQSRKRQNVDLQIEPICSNAKCGLYIANFKFNIANPIFQISNVRTI